MIIIAISVFYMMNSEQFGKFVQKSFKITSKIYYRNSVVFLIDYKYQCKHFNKLTYEVDYWSKGIKRFQVRYYFRSYSRIT